MSVAKDFLISKYKDPSKYDLHHIYRMPGANSKGWFYRFMYNTLLYKGSTYDKKGGYIKSLEAVIEARDNRMLEIVGCVWSAYPNKIK